MIIKNPILWIVVGFVILSAILHFGSLNLADSDSLFYMRLASLYPERGILNVDFPWTQFTSIKTYSASLWYGFTVFLLPFSFFQNQVLGIKIAGVLLTTFALFVLYFAAKRLSLKSALFWPFLIAFSAPNILYRFLMVRPQLISVGLSVLLFSFLISGNWLSVFLFSFAISWFHMNFFWLPILILLTVAGLRFLIEGKIEWGKIGAALSGVLLGIFMRPNSIGALKLVYIQLFKQILERQSGLPMLFGQEHYPLAIATLFRNFSVFTVLWLTAASVFLAIIYKNRGALPSEQKIFLWSGAALSFLFFLLTMFVARRAYDLWIPFGAIFIAGTLTYALPRLASNFRKIAKRFFGAALPLAAAFLFIYSGSVTLRELKERAYRPERFEEISAWLAKYSNPKDIVFNLHWSRFSELFFWNQKNYYIGGLDPIFQYAYNPSLYWKFHYLSIDQVTKNTCASTACTREQLEDTYTALVNDFNAKYIVLTKAENPAVNQWLSGDFRFVKTFETQKEAIYLIRR